MWVDWPATCTVRDRTFAAPLCCSDVPLPAMAAICLAGHSHDSPTSASAPAATRVRAYRTFDREAPAFLSYFAAGFALPRDNADLLCRCTIPRTAAFPNPDI